MTLPPEMERVLFTEEQVAARILEVARDVSEKYRERDLKLVGVLKGSVFFLTALARALDIPVKIDFLAISSFRGRSSGNAHGMVRIEKDLDDPIQDQDVLLVEEGFGDHPRRFADPEDLARHITEILFAA